MLLNWYFQIILSLGVSCQFFAWKVSVFGVILVRIFPHSDWMYAIIIEPLSDKGTFWLHVSFVSLLRTWFVKSNHNRVQFLIGILLTKWWAGFCQILVYLYSFVSLKSSIPCIRAQFLLKYCSWWWHNIWLTSSSLSLKLQLQITFHKRDIFFFFMSSFVVSIKSVVFY